MKVNGEVSVSAEGMADTQFTGKITAIDSVVNEATRMVQVQATLDNPDEKLHPGMFVQSQVLLGSSSQVITLPAPAISYAPYGDSVYVVGEMEGQNGQSYRGVRQQFVKLGGSRGDLVAVVSGVNPGDEIVTSGVFKLRNGAAVNVDNKIQPTSDPAPTPEDN
jgi:membrane fusion protein (multidrug efflux system)